ncbi:hypothetical protein, partial [Rothia nasimurium]
PTPALQQAAQAPLPVATASASPTQQGLVVTKEPKALAITGTTIKFALAGGAIMLIIGMGMMYAAQRVEGKKY